MKADCYIGLDYGVRRVAWAILIPNPVDLEQSSLEVGELVLAVPKDLSERCEMCQLARLITAFNNEVGWRIDDTTMVGIERPITGASGNARTASQLGMVAGALTVVAVSRSAGHVLLSPSTWKKRAIGFGNATKEQVMEAMTARYQLKDVSQDIADATAIATACWRAVNEEEPDDGS